MSDHDNTITISNLFYECAALFAIASFVEHTVIYNISAQNTSMLFRISCAFVCFLYGTILLFSYKFIRHTYFWHLRNTAMLWTVLYTICIMTSLGVYYAQGPLPVELYLLPLGLTSTYFLTNSNKIRLLAAFNIAMFLLLSVIIIFQLKPMFFIVYLVSAYNIYFILNLLAIGRLLKGQ